MRSFRKPLCAAVVTMLAYFLQVCTVPYIQIAGSAPNLCFVVLSLLSVSYGRLYAFIAGSIIGILMEVMLSSINLMFVVLYPVLTLAWSIVYADWSDRRREMRRVEGKDLSQLIPFARVLLCTACMALSYEIIMMAVIYLNGIDLTGAHVLRLFGSIAYSLFAVMVLYWPTRKFLGMYARRLRAKTKKGGESY